MWKWKSTRGVVSIELAIVLVGILVPLIIGSADFLFAMLGRGNVMSAIAATEQLATTYPNNATNQTDINDLLAQQGGPGLYQYQPAALSFACLQQNGTESSATISYTNGYDNTALSSSAASANLTDTKIPTAQAQIGANNIGTVSCATGYLQTFATYYIAENIQLPVLMPILGKNFTYKAHGTVWIR